VILVFNQALTLSLSLKPTTQIDCGLQMCFDYLNFRSRIPRKLAEQYSDDSTVLDDRGSVPSRASVFS
jgi:hypothetical protein